MDKIKYLPLALFSIATLKLIALGSSYSDALTLLILGAAAAYYQFHSHNNEITKLTNKVNDLAKEQESLKTHVAGLKIGQQMRTMNVR